MGKEKLGKMFREANAAVAFLETATAATRTNSYTNKGSAEMNSRLQKAEETLRKFLRSWPQRIAYIAVPCTSERSITKDAPETDILVNSSSLGVFASNGVRYWAGRVLLGDDGWTQLPVADFKNPLIFATDATSYLAWKASVRTSRYVDRKNPSRRHIKLDVANRTECLKSLEKRNTAAEMADIETAWKASKLIA